MKGTITVESPPPSLSSVLKNNPLYGDVSFEEAMEERKKNPSWTAEEYDRRSLHTNLSGHLKVVYLGLQTYAWCFPGGSVVKICLAMQRTKVQFLVGERRSHVPWSN